MDRRDGRAGPALRWLYVDFNSYFASVEQQLEPRLRGRPVAVVPVDTDSTCAIAASYEAKAFGVRTGTPIYEAKRLCPEIICVLARHEHYVDFHHRIIAEIDRHVPVAAVCSIDEMACQLMENEATEPALIRIAAAIKAGLRERIGVAICCSIGAAPNRYLAKVATDLEKPDGFTILRAEDLPARLLLLPLRDFPGIGANMERRLIAQGITSTRAMMALDRPQMRRVWGSIWGERMWYLLRGVDLPELQTERRSVGHSHVLAPDMRGPVAAGEVARRLVLKAGSRLRRMGYYATTLTLSLRFEHGARVETQERFWRAQDNITLLARLNQAWTRLGKGGGRIKKLSVTLHGLVPVDGVQDDLLLPVSGLEMAERAKAERLSHAMDKLNLRFSRDTVLLGVMPSRANPYAGTKIAFTRIPDREEFFE